MKFNCFPKRQEMYLVYSNYKVFKSKLFLDLTLQSSPKNSIFYRFLKSTIGFYISSIFRHSFNTPNANPNYLGIIKMDRYIYFELNNHNIPVYVWRKSSNQIWTKEQFIGFQLFSNYTLTEFQNKSSVVEKAFGLQWEELNKKKPSHGDFTHFNILVDTDLNIHFIDNKAHQNSKLFDFFYFYSYLEQCLDRCQTMTNTDKSTVLISLEVIILKICEYSSKNDFLIDFNSIVLPEKWGLTNIDKQYYLKLFKKRLSERINKTFNL
jgi:hypothetical protein